MKKHLFVLLVLTAAILAVSSCTKSTPLGAELIEQDRNLVNFADTLSIKASSIKEDSVITYAPTFQLSTYIIGMNQDPIFGLTEASISAQFRYPTNSGPPNFESDAVIDSIVLALEYDTAAFYGPQQEPWNIEVFQISETMDPDTTYYSNRVFNTDPTLLGGAYNFIPNTTDSIEVMRDDTIGFLPHLRIRLDDALGTRLLGIDSATYSDIDRFLPNLEGLQIRASSITEGLIAFDLPTDASRLTVYYSTGADKKDYFFDVTAASAKAETFEHDSPSSILFDDQSFGDSLLFVQGMSGSVIEVEFPNASDLENVIINKAELECTVAVLPGDDETNYPAISQLLLYARTSEGGFLEIEDVLRSRTSTGVLDASVFGGFPESTTDQNGNSIITYKLNLAATFQDIIQGEVDNKIYIRPFTKEQNSRRVVLYGPGHSTYPLKLNLTYTNL